MGLANIECIAHSGDPADLVDRWHTRDVILIDAMRTGTKPSGSMIALEPLLTDFDTVPAATSSHALSLKEALELATILERLPKRLLVIGIEGADFAQGAALSPVVSKAVKPTIQLITQTLQQWE